MPDHLAALRVLRADDEEKRDQILEDIGARGTIDRRLLMELARETPVHDPPGFQTAQRNLVLAIEVLDRNGAANVKAPAALGPLRSVVALLVHLVARWIVRRHLKRTTSDVRRLYERREAAAVGGSVEFHMLRHARENMARVEAGLRGNQSAIPAFLIGGAFLTGAFSATLSVILAAGRSLGLLTTLSAFSIVLLGFLAWVTIYAAAIARHHIRLTTFWALTQLYEALGAAGTARLERTSTLVLVAIAFLFMATAVPPLAAWLFLSVP